MGEGGRVVVEGTSSMRKFRCGSEARGIGGLWREGGEGFDDVHSVHSGRVVKERLRIHRRPLLTSKPHSLSPPKSSTPTTNDVVYYRRPSGRSGWQRPKVLCGRQELRIGRRRGSPVIAVGRWRIDGGTPLVDPSRDLPSLRSDGCGGPRAGRG